ncbi:MAG: prepilin peptidase [Actinomycetota bacterium]|nr:prepilin peptidase [Actinomycetota bacterium]
MTWLLAVVCGVLGLAVGSFLNVVIARVPRGESVVRPRSRCPRCGSEVRPRDNVPVLSWVLLRGRCRDCGTRIGWRYPLVEAGTAVLFAVLALRFGPDPALPAFLYLGAVGVALAVIDLDVKRLPNALTLPSYVVGVVLLAVATLGEGGLDDLVRALIGMAALYAVYFLLVLAYPRGMGFGDVKLAGVLGLYCAWLGWPSWVVALAGGFLLGGVWSVGLLVAGRAGRGSSIPFGPFMLAAALAAVLAGDRLAAAYLAVALG